MALPAETAHTLAVTALRLAQSAPPLRRRLERTYRVSGRDELRQGLLNLAFANPIGLAAGFDKDGLVIPGMAALGFGWLEVGAVTPRPQPGNPRPRLFRYRAAASLENAMGFNNRGGEHLRGRLARAHPASVPVFVNLGKNKVTPNDCAIDDYLRLIEVLGDSCDGFVLNLSSPNTPGLRDLQHNRTLAELVGRARSATARPMFVKLSPDLDIETARDVAGTCADAGADGLVLTNTTTDYSLLPEARRCGGLSGRVLKARSIELLRALAEDLFGRCLIVSVGGVSSADDAYARLRAGAHLVQLYTALVFEGPALVRRLVEELAGLLAADGLQTIADAVGADLGRKEPEDVDGR
ncbi:MAG: quinone-dependent dihydroorotate dehydrogenase [Thermoanaerobaculia bacterium]